MNRNIKTKTLAFIISFLWVLGTTLVVYFAFCGNTNTNAPLFISALFDILFCISLPFNILFNIILFSEGISSFWMVALVIALKGFTIFILGLLLHDFIHFMKRFSRK